MYQELKRTCTVIVLLTNLLFSGVAAAVAVVVFLINSLMLKLPSELEEEDEVLVDESARKVPQDTSCVTPL